jgi:hypothetical protein
MTEDKIYIVPAPGLKVRDDRTLELLPGEGAWKPKTSYWLRRVKVGDVLESKPQRPPASKTAPKPPKGDA